MIKSSRSRALRNHWQKAQSAGVKHEWLKRVNLILSTMDQAKMPAELNVPGLALHPLKGNMQGRFSVTVGGNWRITFGWDQNDAVDMDLEDYHGH